MIKTSDVGSIDDDIKEEILTSGDNESENPGVKYISSYDEFKSLIDRDFNTFVVFGKTGCNYCELYKPVLEKASKDYNIEILYVDLLAITTDDYYNILDTDLIIPGKCTASGLDTFIKDGFGTPLSLFVNKGVVYDCIRGYKNDDSLTGSLKLVGYIK